MDSREREKERVNVQSAAPSLMLRRKVCSVLPPTLSRELNLLLKSSLLAFSVLSSDSRTDSVSKVRVFGIVITTDFRSEGTP